MSAREPLTHLLTTASEAIPLPRSFTASADRNRVPMSDTISAPQALAPATGPTPQKLKRSIGVVGGTLLTLSCVTPASTLFVVVPDLFASLGTWTALTIAIGSLLCVGVAFCYSELGTLIPSAGGEYAIVSTLAGRLAGWLVFVLSLLVVMIVPPVIAMGTADYLAPIIEIPAPVAGGGVMLLATLAGLLDLRANAWITGIFLVLEVVAAALVAVLGFAHSERGADALVHGTVAAEGGGTSTVTAMMVVSGLAIALFITQGFSTAVYLSEELENPGATWPGRCSPPSPSPPPSSWSRSSPSRRAPPTWTRWPRATSAGWSPPGPTRPSAPSSASASPSPSSTPASSW